jgi:hypothetical protein
MPFHPGQGHPRTDRDLHAYLTACVLAARPSRSRTEALRALGYEPPAEPAGLPHPVDWEAIEAEARRQGCTVADVVYDIAARD